MSKVKIRIPEDGTYELQLHEKDKDGKSILTKKRYRLVHEGLFTLSERLIQPIVYNFTCLSIIIYPILLNSECRQQPLIAVTVAIY